MRFIERRKRVPSLGGGPGERVLLTNTSPLPSPVRRGNDRDLLTYIKLKVKANIFSIFPPLGEGQGEVKTKKINIKKTLRQSTKNVKLSIWINNSK